VFSALKRIMDAGEMELDIIINPKINEDGQAVIQACLCLSVVMIHIIIPFSCSSKLQPALQSNTSKMHMG
jgi:hypothetical protein